MRANFVASAARGPSRTPRPGRAPAATAGARRLLPDARVLPGAQRLPCRGRPGHGRNFPGRRLAGRRLPGRRNGQAALIEVGVQRLGRWERAVTCRGSRYKVVAASQGSRLLIEVDGVAHVITRDDGGQVRCPSPAFVVAVSVAPGDIVRAGDPLAVVESMKMETTIAAPHDGTVRSVYAQVNTQVEAGAPLVALRALQAPTGQTRSRGPSGSGGPSGTAAGFAGLATPSGSHDLADVDHLLRAYLLGYDVEDGDAHELSRERGKRLADVPPDDDGKIRSDQELLEIFADAAALSRPVREDERRGRAPPQLARAPAHLPVVPRSRAQRGAR